MLTGYMSNPLALKAFFLCKIDLPDSWRLQKDLNKYDIDRLLWPVEDVFDFFFINHYYLKKKIEESNHGLKVGSE